MLTFDQNLINLTEYLSGHWSLSPSKFPKMIYLAHCLYPVDYRALSLTAKVTFGSTHFSRVGPWEHSFRPWPSLSGIYCGDVTLVYRPSSAPWTCCRFWSSTNPIYKTSVHRSVIWFDSFLWVQWVLFTFGVVAFQLVVSQQKLLLVLTLFFIFRKWNYFNHSN